MQIFLICFIDILTFTTAVQYNCRSNNVSCGCGYSDVAFRSTRIVGGENAVDNSWSMIVSLRFYGSEEHSCAGTLLSESFILTAAHCVEHFATNESVNITILAGVTSRSDSSGYQRNVAKLYIHPNYTGYPYFLNNIAVLELNYRLNFHNNPVLGRTCVHRIGESLLTQQQHLQNVTRLAIIGWGTMRTGSFITSDILKQIQVTVIDNENSICKNAIHDSQLQFCAGLQNGGKDACLGDSGGPVLYWTGRYWEQVGVIGYTLHCGRAGYPGVHTRLSPYWEWMENILNEKREYIEPQDPSPFPTTTTTRFSKTPRSTTKKSTTTAVSISDSSTNDISTSETITAFSSHNSNLSVTTRLTERTTTEPVVKKTYTCIRNRNECGCSLTDVIVTQHSQQSSSGKRTGENANPNSWSMIVSLQINGKKHDCTGTILSNAYILTSAQCASKATGNNTIVVVAGIHDLYQYKTSIRNVDQIYIHENSHVHDIAILHLNESLKLETEPLFSTSCLSDSSISGSETVPELIVVGWKNPNNSYRASNVTQQVSVESIIDMDHLCFITDYNDTYQLCVGMKRNSSDRCTESYGEPLFVYRNEYWEQVGILSKAYGCIPIGHSGVYTRLSAYFDWMQNVMQDTTLPSRQPTSTTTTTNTSSKHKRNILIFYLFLIMLLFSMYE